MSSKTVVPYGPNNYTPPPMPTPSPKPSPTPLWRSRVYIATADKGIFYSTTFSGVGGAMPTWTTVNSGLANTKITDMRPDPFNPGGRQYCFVDGGEHLYRRTGGAWSSVLDVNAFCVAQGIKRGYGTPRVIAFNTDINTNGYIGAVIGAGADLFSQEGVYYCYSVNYGSSWVLGNGGSLLYEGANVGFTSPVSVWVGYFRGSSAYPAGRVIYITLSSAWGAARDFRLVRSFNKGASFSDAFVIESDLAMVVQPDAYQNVIYRYGQGGTGLPTAYLQRSTDYGSTWTTLFDSAVMGYYPKAHSYYTLSTVYPGDGTKATTLRLLAFQNTDGSGTVRLYKTTNAGSSWSYITLPVSGILWGRWGLSLVQDSPNYLYLVAAGTPGFTDTSLQHIYVSNDECATLEGKAGNDRTSSSTTGIPYNAGGVRHILQVWT